MPHPNGPTAKRGRLALARAIKQSGLAKRDIEKAAPFTPGFLSRFTKNADTAVGRYAAARIVEMGILRVTFAELRPDLAHYDDARIKELARVWRLNYHGAQRKVAKRKLGERMAKARARAVKFASHALVP